MKLNFPPEPVLQGKVLQGKVLQGKVLQGKVNNFIRILTDALLGYHSPGWALNDDYTAKEAERKLLLKMVRHLTTKLCKTFLKNTPNI